eukprot:10239313-Alexandrium_andersonii.AAC.1
MPSPHQPRVEVDLAKKRNVWSFSGHEQHGSTRPAFGHKGPQVATFKRRLQATGHGRMACDVDNDDEPPLITLPTGPPCQALPNCPPPFPTPDTVPMRLLPRHTTHHIQLEPGPCLPRARSPS